MPWTAADPMVKPMPATAQRREEREMMPAPAASREVPAEHACAVMAAELDALGQDIARARRRARNAANGVHEPGRRTQSPDGEHVALASGRKVAIRPIRPQDGSRLARHFATMGALTRFHRFLTRQDHLSSHQVEYLTRVDHVEHEALVALDSRTGEIVGVARYVREPANPVEAKVAAAVVDTWQRRGVGKALLERLSAHARANGVTTFTGATAPSNVAARRLFGGVATVREQPGTLHITAYLERRPV
jgi:GNAT superfamily N-acetyltransferase